MNLARIVLFAVFASFVLTGLRTRIAIPEGAEVVKDFDQQRYLGTWYEIARIDYKWEKNLNNVTATYSIKENGMIKVENKGYNVKKSKWQESEGKAKLDKPGAGALMVSFFGPFYAEYNIIALDKDYQYALVAGESTDYLWILSRQKTIPELIKNEFLDQAKRIGYDTNRLTWVGHDPAPSDSASTSAR
ncbi:MAG: lipocalin family protein [Bacteroidota bacterium]